MLVDAMFDEDGIFCPPSFDEQIYYDDSMPPIYDDYIDESGFGRVSTLGSNDPTIFEDVEYYCDNYESGFGEVMTLFNDDSTISEEVPIDYENKVAIYDDYCDDMYAIKNNDNHESCHHDFNFYWIMPIKYLMVVVLLSFLPLLLMRINLLMWRVTNFLCL